MSQLPGPSRTAPKTGQREIRSCKFCYRRKLKCDKQYPCSRCVSRGLGELCEQETVVVNGRLVGGALTADRNKRWVPTVAELMEENKALHRKITSQEKMMQSMGHSPGHGTHDPTNSSISRSRRGRTEDREQDGYSRRSTSRASTAQTEDEMEIADSKDSEEDLAPIRQVFGLTDQEVVAGQQPLHLFTQPSAQTIQSLRSLVPQRQSGDLVRFHCKYLHWIHGVFHIPSFLRDHDIWVADLALGRGDEEPYDYFALYFAIIACSLHFMSEEEAMSLGYSIETLEMLPRFWFDTSLNCLQLCGFMLNPTLRVLQTICILPTIAHAFDRSMYLASMMHSALGLARDLKIHLLRDESSSKRFGGPIRSQIARRIWWCLMIADSLTPGAQHPFHLVYPAAWTTAPANLNDADLLDGQPIVPRPLGQVTCVSHLLLMGRVANIFRDYCHSFSNDQSVKSILRNVKQFDDQLLHVHQDLPELKPVPGETYKLEYDEHGGFVWHSWSRYLWLSAIPGMRIQLWRYCLDRSYKDERFAEARSICLAASRDLITAAKTPVPSIFRKNWHVFSYTVMAGTILGTELVRRPDRTSLESLEAEVLDVLQLLKQESRPNAMVNRGIDILENMLDVYRSTSPRHSQNADALPYPEELFQPDIADPWGLYGTDATMPDLFYPIFDPSAWPLGDLDVQNFEGAGTSSG